MWNPSALYGSAILPLWNIMRGHVLRLSTAPSGTAGGYAEQEDVQLRLALGRKGAAV
ncbi:MAG: hypothetical protein ACREAZ_09490 [Nitrososphaera sp.]